MDINAGLLPWVVARCLQFADTSSRYTSSLYWAVATMATVGYGDFVPFTNVERCLVLAVELVAGVLAGCLFGSVGVLLRGFDSLDGPLHATLSALAALAKRHRLPKALARRVCDSAQYRAHAAQGLASCAVLGELSAPLRAQVLDATEAAALVAAHPALRAAPKPFLRALVASLRVQTHLPGELICAQARLQRGHSTCAAQRHS